MRFVTWNCAQKFREKCVHVVPLQPDILTVQEVERFAKYPALKGDPRFTFRDRAEDALNNRRGIGVFSCTETGALITPVDADAPNHSFRRYRVAHPSRPFQVIAVWTAPSSLLPRREWYMQAHRGMAEHMTWIRATPTVVMGDFNNNASFRAGDWAGLQALMEQAGLVSVFHHCHAKEFGKEESPTYYHWRRLNDSAQHIDYIFVPRPWLDRIERLEVGVHAEWCRKGMSDHVPLIMDVNI